MADLSDGTVLGIKSLNAEYTGNVTEQHSFDLGEINPEILSMGDVDLGFMSYRVNFEDNGIPVNGDWDNPQFSDRASTEYYRPHMISGVIDVNRYREGIKC